MPKTTAATHAAPIPAPEPSCLTAATPATTEAAIPAPSRVFVTVKQLAQQQPALTEGGIRWDLHNATLNGLAKSGAIIRRGRRVLIDPEKYLDWMASRTEAAA